MEIREDTKQDPVAPLFTVFTPTFNRAEELRRVYDCLLDQNFTDFEWLVVDDGSTDATVEDVERWRLDPKTWFPIVLVRQANGHKKVAHNTAIQKARGVLLLTLDSDDECVPYALERLSQYWFSIPKTERSEFSAVTVLCMYEDGAVVGDRFPCSDYIDSRPLDMAYKYKVSGEKWGFQRTDVLRQYPFSEAACSLPGYVPEGLIWNRISRLYKTRFVNDALRVYHQDGMSRERVTGSGCVRSNAPGSLLYKLEFLGKDVDYFWVAPLSVLKESAGVTRVYLHCEAAHRTGFWPSSFIGKVLVLVGIPLGLIVYCRDLVSR